MTTDLQAMKMHVIYYVTIMKTVAVLIFHLSASSGCRGGWVTLSAGPEATGNDLNPGGEESPEGDNRGGTEIWGEKLPLPHGVRCVCSFPSSDIVGEGRMKG